MFDRNTLLAILLSALVLFAYSFFFAPKPTVNPAKPNTQNAAPAPSEPKSVYNGGQSASYQKPYAPTSETSTPQKDIQVKTPLYTAVFSSKGGTLKGFSLNHYKHFDGKSQVELVAAKQYGALALEFTTPQNRNIDTRALNFTPSQSGNISVNAPQTLTFSTEINGGKLKQIYTFDPKSYEVGYRVETQNADKFMTGSGYELAWMGGLPFSEEVIEREAETAQSVVRYGGETIHHDIAAEKGRQTYSGNIEWIGVKNRFFLAAIIPQKDRVKGGELHAWMKGVAKERSYWEDYSARLSMNRPTQADAFKLYLGPQDYEILKKYNTGLEDLNISGWFAWISRVISHYVIQPVFNVMKKVTTNYGIIILIFALLIKIVTHPLTKSSQKSMAKMKVLQPKMQALQEKYKDDPVKLQQQMGKLYKEEQINPLGGCLPMLLQMPILIAMYSFFPSALDLRQQPFLWANDLSAPDVLFHLPFTIPFYGNFVTGFALLMAITMVIQMQVQGDTQPANPANAMMKWFFPVMLLCLFNNFASGLNWYYFVFNILSIAQQYYMNKHLSHQNEAAAATPQKGSVTVGGAPKTKTKSKKK